MPTYYIDPSAGTNGNGSESSPWNSWSNVTWGSGNTYLQKAGTVATVFPNLGFTNITLDRYGIGANPVISITALQMQISGANFKISNFKISGTQNGLILLADGFIGDSLEISDCLTGFGLSFGTAGGGTIKNSWIHDCGDDNIEVRAGALTCIVENCLLESPSKATVGGDNIGGANAGTYNILVTNSTLKKTDAYKQAIMSGTSGYIKVYSCIIENLGAGGTISCQGASLFEVKGCKIYAVGTNAGVYGSGANGTTVTDANIIGNVIDIPNSTFYSLQIASDSAGGVCNVYNNTLLKTTGTGPNFNVPSGKTGSINFKNNLVKGGAHMFYHQGTVTIASASNNIYETGKAFVYNGFTQATLALWRTASSQDANSIQDSITLNSDYSLPSNSPAIGFGVKHWSNARPAGFNGEPFPDSFLDAGGYQSTLHPYHPINLR